MAGEMERWTGGRDGEMAGEMTGEMERWRER